eukprot:9502711-Pyramimonas_sp.AAC.1
MSRALREARDDGQTYVGPAPLSMLARGQGARVREEFSDLIHDDSLQTVWCDLWKYIDTDAMGSTRQLIVALVSAGLSGWTQRVMLVATRFPLLFLRMVEDDAREEVHERVAIAEMLD